MKENTRLLVTLTVEELKELINECLSSALGTSSVKTSNKTDNTELISRFDACRMFGVSRTIIDKWRKYKLLPREIKIASRVYFNKQELIEFINKERR